MHGIEEDAVTFHEVGAVDSIVDIVAAARLISLIGAGRWTSGPLPLGSGRIKTAHGILPVPAPATAIPPARPAAIDDGIAGERVTPTGAAIARYLVEPRATSNARVLRCRAAARDSARGPCRGSAIACACLAFDEGRVGAGGRARSVVASWR